MQTTESTALMSHSSECIMLCNLNSNQSLAWKLSIFECAKEENVAKNNLAR